MKKKINMKEVYAIEQKLKDAMDKNRNGEVELPEGHPINLQSKIDEVKKEDDKGARQTLSLNRTPKSFEQHAKLKKNISKDGVSKKRKQELQTNIDGLNKKINDITIDIINISKVIDSLSSETKEYPVVRTKLIRLNRLFKSFFNGIRGKLIKPNLED